MNRLLKIRAFAILWIWLIASNTTPALAQFDEMSRNHWILDVSYGFIGTADPNVSSSDHSSNVKINSIYSKDEYSSISVSFGVNHRLFHNFYAGARIGYKHYGNKAGGSKYRNYGKGFTYDESASTNLSYNVINLPIEFGYNHTYSHKRGLNIYASVILGYCLSAKASDAYFDVEKEQLNLDGAAGLRYFFNHFYIGASYHHAIALGQEQLGNDSVEASIGFRF